MMKKIVLGKPLTKDELMARARMAANSVEIGEDIAGAHLTFLTPYVLRWMSDVELEHPLRLRRCRPSRFWAGNAAHLEARLLNGLWTHFSWRKAVGGDLTHRQKLMQALRQAVMNDLPPTRRGLDRHHVKSFHTIVNEWLLNNNLQTEMVEVTSVEPWGYAVDSQLTTSFRLHHKNECVIRYLTKAEHHRTHHPEPALED